MTEIETTMADLQATGISTTAHPMTHIRSDLAGAGILSTAQLCNTEAGTRVRVAGVVTRRQRPATASGVTFINLEDETGMANIVVRTGTWSRFRRSPATPAPSSCAARSNEQAR